VRFQLELVDLLVVKVALVDHPRNKEHKGVDNWVVDVNFAIVVD